MIEMLFVSGEAFGFMVLALLVGFGLGDYHYRALYDKNVETLISEKKQVHDRLMYSVDEVQQKYRDALSKEVYAVDLIKIILEKERNQSFSYEKCVSLYDKLPSSDYNLILEGYNALREEVIEFLKKHPDITL